MSLKSFNRLYPDAVETAGLFRFFPGLGVTTLSRTPPEEAILYEEYRFVDKRLVGVTVVFGKAADFDGILLELTGLNGEAGEYSLRDGRRIVRWEGEECQILLSERVDGMPIPVAFRRDAGAVLFLQDARGGAHLHKILSG